MRGGGMMPLAAAGGVVCTASEGVSGLFTSAMQHHELEIWSTQIRFVHPTPETPSERNAFFRERIKFLICKQLTSQTHIIRYRGVAALKILRLPQGYYMRIGVA